MLQNLFLNPLDLVQLMVKMDLCPNLSLLRLDLPRNKFRNIGPNFSNNYGPRFKFNDAKNGPRSKFW